MARKLLDSHQVADILGVAEITLRVWRMHGKGPRFKKVGALVRYEQSVIEDWLAEQDRISTSQRAPASDLAATA